MEQLEKTITRIHCNLPKSCLQPFTVNEGLKCYFQTHGESGEIFSHRTVEPIVCFEFFLRSMTKKEPKSLRFFPIDGRARLKVVWNQSRTSTSRSFRKKDCFKQTLTSSAPSKATKGKKETVQECFCNFEAQANAAWIRWKKGPLKFTTSTWICFVLFPIHFRANSRASALLPMIKLAIDTVLIEVYRAHKFKTGNILVSLLHNRSSGSAVAENLSQ